jgi:hypothetical protein
MSEITFEAGHCPTCGMLRDAQFTHVITGDENFLHRTLASVGIPPLHIIRAQNGLEYRFYELTGDLPEALHFRHFEQNEPIKFKPAGERIRLKSEVRLVDTPVGSAPGRIRIKEEPAKSTLSIKSAAGKTRTQIKKNKENRVRISEPKPWRVRYKSAEHSPRIHSKLGGGRVKVCKV